MKVVNRYVYPKSTRESISGLRHYTVDGEEKKLPSVTTVIAQTKSKKDKEGIERWKAKVGEETAEKIKNEAAARGTAMHKYLEDLIPVLQLHLLLLKLISYCCYPLKWTS